MTPEEKLKEIDDKLDEAHALVISLQNMRREHINRYDLNKKWEIRGGKVKAEI